jgi:hypothetical protein
MMLDRPPWPKQRGRRSDAVASPEPADPQTREIPLGSGGIVWM